MSVLVYVDHIKGTVKKGTYEAVNYAAKVAESLGGKEVIALALGTTNNDSLAALGTYGASKVLTVNDAAFDTFDSRPIAKVIAEAASANAAEVVVFSHNSSGKALAPRVAVRLEAGLITGASSVPSGDDFTVRRSVFSGKAFADYTINSAIKVLSVNPNSFPLEEGEGTASVEAFSTSVGAGDFKVKVLEVSRSTDTVPLPEAELVVSAGRGLKGPENWGMVEDLATILGATTACSRPVADVGWRPHHEHVGQTGVTVQPNLYIAIGISGAIQHLAGVNNSKVIVVINKDPEAPFFKAADYGIVGDAFEVVPKLIEALKEFKNS